MHATCGLTEYTIAAGGWLGVPWRHDHIIIVIIIVIIVIITTNYHYDCI
jgi:hypothetical protein